MVFWVAWKHFRERLAALLACWFVLSTIQISVFSESPFAMAKPHRTLKKANKGRRPANAKARKLKRSKIKTC